MWMLQYNFGATIKKRQEDVTIFILQSSYPCRIIMVAAKKDTITDTSQIND